MIGSNLWTFRIGERAPSSRSCSVAAPPALHDPLVAERDQQQPDHQTARQEGAVGVAAQHQARGTEEQQDSGVEREVGRAQQVASGAGGGVDVGDPVGRAAQGVGDGGGEGRDRGGLDPLQERRAVGPHHDQRHQPPQGAEQGEHRPPQHQRAAAGTRRTGQQPHHPERDDREGRRGVDAADEGDRDRGPGGGDPRRPAFGTDHERQQHPRRQGHRPALAGDRSQRGEHPWRHRVGDAGQQAGEVAAHAERPHQTGGAGEGDGQHQPPPQPLHHPAGDPGQHAGEVERPGREEVAVRLVLQLAEGSLAVPQVQRTQHEVAGCGHQVELRVGHDVAGVLGEREADQQPAARQHPPGEPAHARLIGGAAPARGSR